MSLFGRGHGHGYIANFSITRGTGPKKLLGVTPSPKKKRNDSLFAQTAPEFTMENPALKQNKIQLLSSQQQKQYSHIIVSGHRMPDKNKVKRKLRYAERKVDCVHGGG